MAIALLRSNHPSTMAANRKGPPRLFISLYERGDLPESEQVTLPPGMFGFHWALIPIPSYLTIAGSRVVEHTIQKGQGTDAWRTGARVVRKVTDDKFLHVCIALPSILGGLTANDLVEALAEQSPLQGDTPLLELHNEWSSAQWCIRALRSLVEVELIDLPLHTDHECALFYRRITSIGTAAGTSSYPCKEVEGVRVVEYN